MQLAVKFDIESIDIFQLRQNNGEGVEGHKLIKSQLLTDGVS